MAYKKARDVHPPPTHRSGATSEKRTPRTSVPSRIQQVSVRKHVKTLQTGRHSVRGSLTCISCQPSISTEFPCISIHSPSAPPRDGASGGVLFVVPRYLQAPSITTGQERSSISGPRPARTVSPAPRCGGRSGPGPRGDGPPRARARPRRS